MRTGFGAVEVETPYMDVSTERNDQSDLRAYVSGKWVRGKTEFSPTIGGCTRDDYDVEGCTRDN